MAHELTESDHMVSGNGIIPWHSLGTIVQGLMTSEEVLAKARLNWNVVKKTIQVAGGKAIPGKFATVREDTNEALGVVGKVYTPIQNTDGLNILDPVIGKDAVYETAGSLRGGKIVWFLASLNKEYFLGSKDDKMKQYFLVYLSHDGSRPASVRFVNTRVVCMNTLSAATAEARPLVTIRHTKNYQDKVNEVHRIVGLADQHAQEFEKIFASLRNTKMSESEAQKFTKTLFPGEAKQSRDIQDQVFGLFRTGVGNEGKTRADMLNAVTEYISHHKTVRAKAPEAKAFARFENSLFGYGLTVGNDAAHLLLN
jgi:phage/plasmid-like protein (TIGR03299 family)